MRIIKNRDDCTGCAACAQICPQFAIEMTEDGEGFDYPMINFEKCIKCGLCAKACPIKRNVAIITLFYNNYNFGAQLQNYAVQHYLKAHFLSCETIQDFAYPQPELFYYMRDGVLRTIRKLLGGFTIINKWIENKKILIEEDTLSDFQREMINIGPKINVRHVPSYLDKRYDFFCVGSDVVWSGYNSFYFLRFTNRKKRICMMPSFGEYDFCEEKIRASNTLMYNLSIIKRKLKGGDSKLYKKGLSGFDYLCCRESGGAEVIRKMVGKPCETITDPTLLVDRTEWERIAKKPDNYYVGKYILLYLFGELNKKTLCSLQRIANERQCKIIDIHKDLGGTDKIRPEEFLFWIKNAELIITDSFHGTCFSIVFGREFYALSNGRKVDGELGKIGSLLKVFNLSYRMIPDEADEKIFNCEKIDYCNVECILEEEKNKAENFFKKSNLF